MTREPTYSNYAVICPHCDHEHADAHEYFRDGDGGRVIQCDECFVSFYAEQHTSVSYTGTVKP